MKLIFLLQLLVTLSFASFNNFNSFEADFNQTITDSKGKQLNYSGHIIASKPQNAVWNYITPIKKDIYINFRKVTIVEPNLEQVIIRKINSNFNIFKILKNSKQIDRNTFIAKFENSKFTIKIYNSLIYSISYNDELDNKVKIIFTKQVNNKKVKEEKFKPKIPADYDLIKD